MSGLPNCPDRLHRGAWRFGVSPVSAARSRESVMSSGARDRMVSDRDRWRAW